MSDAPPPDAADRAEARATRRRWITLAELVAVAGLVIAGASLWLSWSDRRSDQAEKVSAQAGEQHARAIVTLAGEITSDGESMRLSDPAHPIDGVTVTFPTALGIAPQSSVLGPRIAVDWFADKLKALDRPAGRLPVLLNVGYWDGETKRSSVALYDVAWQRRSRFPVGHKIVMARLGLRARVGTQTALDAAWRQEQAR